MTASINAAFLNNVLYRNSNDYDTIWYHTCVGKLSVICLKEMINPVHKAKRNKYIAFRVNIWLF